MRRLLIDLLAAILDRVERAILPADRELEALIEAHACVDDSEAIAAAVLRAQHELALADWANEVQACADADLAELLEGEGR